MSPQLLQSLRQGQSLSGRPWRGGQTSSWPQWSTSAGTMERLNRPPPEHIARPK